MRSLVLAALAVVIALAAAGGCEGKKRNIATTPPGAPPGAKFLGPRDDAREVYGYVMSAPPQGIEYK